MDFSDIGYLKNGGRQQSETYDVLVESRGLERLRDFNPILVGTFPIDIAIDSSDLDIACHFKGKAAFLRKLNEEFATYEGFQIKELEIGNLETVLCTFSFSGYEFEIFGQTIPVHEQMGYRHMVIEHRILERNGNDFKNKIVELKRNGLKTEPAFAQLLGLEGDPYLELLKFEADSNKP
ncbi:DUF4269 domain-containing protein [Flavobacterium sp. MAH-1]|uniref:DUF4269 domain-containing protein n=1 Tax=Flavobacterium agri TaxID=2743471 RepID=A0A7Y8XYS5_9FLAO|nr:DUF4269 domain-containing protein [Flavobacterium agri]NUY79329.1 DUF4269 domain-containing protein [Flavobacterium agri]NYA69353.1 DUF4269 domain-containing protein [Flavobacterium agri]